jgi:dTMP kinase
LKKKKWRHTRKRREAFVDLTRSEPERCKLINADQPEDVVALAILSAVEHVLEATELEEATQDRKV